MFSFDIKKPFETLKSANSCKKCKKLLSSPIKILICGHSHCENCLKNHFKCPTCKANFNKTDTVRDEFAEKVLQRIRNIEALFERAGLTNQYRIDNLPLDILNIPYQDKKKDVVQEKKNVATKKEDVVPEKKNVVEKKHVMPEKKNVVEGLENLVREMKKVVEEPKNVIKERNCVIHQEKKKNLMHEKLNVVQEENKVVEEKKNVAEKKSLVPEKKNFMPEKKKNVVEETNCAIHEQKKKNLMQEKLNVVQEKNKVVKEHKNVSQEGKNVVQRMKEFHCTIFEQNTYRFAMNTMKKNSKGETVLHLACKKRKVEEVKNLIEEGVDLNEVDYANWTALHESVESGSIECMKLLLEAGALVNVPGENYVTPLHQAVLREDFEQIQLLLQYGSDIHASDYSGNTTFEYCSSEEIRKVLEAPNMEQFRKEKFFIPKNIKFSIVGALKKNLDDLKENKFVIGQIDKADVWLLVIGDEETLLSLIVLQAIISGVLVIYEKDLQIYLSNKFPIQPDLIPKSISEASKLSILNRLQHKPKLFDGMNFYVLDHIKPVKINEIHVNKEDLIKLIQMGGGKLLSRPPAERTIDSMVKCYPYHATGKLKQCCHYIIYEEQEVPLLTYNMAELRHASSAWLINCILNFKIIEF